MGWGSSLVVECLSNKYKALDLVHSSEDKKWQNKKIITKNEKKSFLEDWDSMNFYELVIMKLVERNQSWNLKSGNKVFKSTVLTTTSIFPFRFLSVSDAWVWEVVILLNWTEYDKAEDCCKTMRKEVSPMHFGKEDIIHLLGLSIFRKQRRGVICK